MVWLCDYLSNRGLQGSLKFKYAISYGESLMNSQRKLIESCFQCEVYDRYGLEELGVVGSECSRHFGFHLNSESFILEVLDENKEKEEAK